MNASINKTVNEDIIPCLQKIEERIASLEYKVGLIYENRINREIEDINNISNKQESSEDDDALENKIGEYMFARAGVLLFIIGIIFLLTFPYKGVNPAVPPLLGYLISLSLFFISKLFRKILPHINVHLVSGAMFIFYFSTLRLYFFSSQPVLKGLSAELLLLAFAFLLSLGIAVRRRSVYMISLSLLMGYITAMVSNNDYVILNGIILLSLLGVYLSLKYNWMNLVIFSILISYFSYLNWLISNPVLSGNFQMRSVDSIFSALLLLYMLIYTSVYYLKGSNIEGEAVINFSSTLNVFLSFGLFFLTTLTTKEFGLLNVLAAAIFLIISAILYLRLNNRYLTFIYAMIGYFALSLAIISYFGFPASFIFLCWQSLLVVSMAIWFRSRFIVVANFLIYLLIVLSFLMFNKGIELTSISFGIVSLLSARIMNWQKERLELKTEQMRNSYLVIALFIIPYALYNNLPEGFVGVSWIAVALIYYALGKVLNSKKYRWMAIVTFAATILFVFLQGISRSDATYKIVSFLVLGVALVFVSITYAYLKNKTALRK